LAIQWFGERVAVFHFCAETNTWSYRREEGDSLTLFSDWLPPFFLFMLAAEDILQVPHLSEVIDRTWNPPDRDRLVAYLRDCPAITAVPRFDPVVCQICGETLERCSSTQQSDGLWIWFKPVVHYVQLHHVRLPDRMVERIRANKYRPPV
jgi:hypothetical protein